MISAMIKHTNMARRVKQMTPRDLKVARDVLDPETHENVWIRIPLKMLRCSLNELGLYMA